MVVFVIFGIFSGIIASGFALVSGSSLLMAVMAYSGVGALTLMGVLARAAICQYISDQKNGTGRQGSISLSF